MFFSTNCFAVSRGSSKLGLNIVVSRLQSKMCLQNIIWIGIDNGINPKVGHTRCVIKRYYRYTHLITFLMFDIQLLTKNDWKPLEFGHSLVQCTFRILTS